MAASAPRPPLTTAVRTILADRPDISDVDFALAFLPEKNDIDARIVGQASNDRLTKFARMILSLVREDEDSQLRDDIVTEASLQRLTSEFRLLASGQLGKVPRVPFGNTGLEMPVATLGCMRFQQAWGNRIQTMDQVGADCQDNLVAILRTAILDYGMVHIETARGYGCSELQLGAALRQLFMTGEVQRSDLIIQTKVNSSPDPTVFRSELETSMSLLGVEYLDLFSIHGLNLPEHLEYCFGQDGNNCMAVVKEFVAAGKIRHVGFSTHGPTDIICQAIETGAFEYVNLHYHFIGSYTASGYGKTKTGGNLEAVELLKSKKMGIFIISPYDKGGALYAPSRTFRNLCMPEYEPMVFHSLWLWNHDKLVNANGSPVPHTFTVGAARPSDLDEAALAAYYQRTQPEEALEKVKAVQNRLLKAYETAVGTPWFNSWWKGLPKAISSQYQIEHNQMVWLYNLIQAFGMYKFAKNRYGSFESNAKTWDYSKSAEENHQKRGIRGWGYVPGLPLDPKQDYAQDLKEVPSENMSRVLEAEAFCLKWLASPRADNDGEKKDNGESSKKAKVEIPAGWKTAYDLRTWPDYPEQPARE